MKLDKMMLCLKMSVVCKVKKMTDIKNIFRFLKIISMEKQNNADIKSNLSYK